MELGMRMDASSVDDFCTLPMAAQLGRLSEFDELFRRQVAAPRWIGLHRLEFTFASVEDLPADVSDLVARESECCSFFDFVIDQRAGRALNEDQLLLQVGVPSSRADVLGALLNRALAAIAQAGE
jgi:hypothetical protein